MCIGKCFHAKPVSCQTANPTIFLSAFLGIKGWFMDVNESGFSIFPWNVNAMERYEGERLWWVLLRFIYSFAFRYCCVWCFCLLFFSFSSLLSTWQHSRLIRVQFLRPLIRFTNERYAPTEYSILNQPKLICF